ncbi:hypothetical protein RHAL1_03499 [Beijerinckiaceae bacterium RH AL1]|nr:hypothetical protein [Beijerinckiaceae bacterium]VVB48791.1 hypothetical protein RHCH11_RHCH11_03434 [Beijerinckiaceae bacterium RH CH11]VVB48870.1 hypothetical protein RHAL8_03430 [Beijerinckiaceae bacterium RH AL8]VVC56570.1 hypothetical protein RHAL1_03499 [Beijerinckiaceae bacterium RH AL1]
MSIRRHTALGAILLALALWAQLLAPLAVMSMERQVDPFSVICSHAKDGGPKPSHHTHRHDCCVLCHVYLGCAPVDGRPAYVALDYPASSPMRWQVVHLAPRLHDVSRGNRPRGPPALV